MSLWPLSAPTSPRRYCRCRRAVAGLHRASTCSRRPCAVCSRACAPTSLNASERKQSWTLCLSWSSPYCMRPLIGSSVVSPNWETSNDCGLRSERAVCSRPRHLSAVRAHQAGEVLMTPESLTLIVIFLLVVALLTKPVGLYIANLMEGRPIWALRIGARFEGLLYRLSGIDPAIEM